ncbi:hypothetical protein [Corallococcus silvisoli]|uniref:hypothetical protein n=1 Tax=Corallococcus silvisoli TaxID=2697031 RepID=UPI00137743F5|nr:hypothetical protein [Corallococcus silvisoli]NBD10830.1 hypothetical protein [Corallococcus silvisoli]
MRNILRVLVVTGFSVGVLSACGPAAEPDGAESSQVEQGIGSTPNCGLGSSLAEKTEWKTTCGACSEVGGDGSWHNGDHGRGGSLYQTCCGASGCGAWKLIRPVCTTC